jgi:beta-glucosidase
MTITPETITPEPEDRADAADGPARSLTTDQKIALTTGADYWSTFDAADAGIRSLRLTDGPHGLRVQDDENPDHLGLNRSLPATCFPPAVTIASSWDRDLAHEVGAALGREARSMGVDVVLGPGLNIKRTPLCGRNFEYFSEDPYLGGVLAGAMVRGLQSTGVAACVKHFAANNQETDRQRISADVDERTLREIYLRTFQIAIREGNPWSIMSSYNRINGVYSAENAWLLTELLREEWGYDGVVMSDWGGVHDPVAALHAGTDLRMPGRPEDDRIRAAEAAGTLDHRALDATVERMRLLAQRTEPGADHVAADLDANHALARRAAAESAVLLTNDGTLPLSPRPAQRIAVLGELARTPRYQGSGSSAVNPTRVVSGWQALSERLGALGAEVAFAAGYSLDKAGADDAVIAEAIGVAAESDVVILFVGLPARYEAEGHDRSTIDLPDDQLALLDALAAVDVPVVVALSNGSAVTTASWRDGVNSIVEFWLTGQAHGEAVADVILGDVNPSGRLAETIPVRLEDTPAFLNFPGERGHVLYGETIHVGYRWYDARDLNVDHPFGHGLSYTTFGYDGLTLSARASEDDTAMEVTVTVTNVGDRPGAEVVQVYVADPSASVQTPERELRGFVKVFLVAGESREVTVPVRREDLQHFDSGVGQWVYEGGRLMVAVGSSSRDLRLTAEIELTGVTVRAPLSVWSTLRDWFDHPVCGPRLKALIESRGGITGRVADLLGDETGQDSVLDVPLQGLIEFPGVPLEVEDAERLAREAG